MTSSAHWVRLAGWVVSLALVMSASACARYQDTRGLHYVGDTLVVSKPGDHRAYETYIRARMAMDAAHPDLELAHRLIREALFYERTDPQLWTTRGEIELRMGKLDRAKRSSVTALQLRPGYPPARLLLSKLTGRPEPAAPVAR